MGNVCCKNSYISSSKELSTAPSPENKFAEEFIRQFELTDRSHYKISSRVNTEGNTRRWQLESSSYTVFDAETIHDYTHRSAPETNAVTTAALIYQLPEIEEFIADPDPTDKDGQTAVVKFANDDVVIPDAYYDQELETLGYNFE